MPGRVWRLWERPNYPGDGELGDAMVLDPDHPTWPQRFKSWTEAACYAVSWMQPGDTLIKDPPDESEPT
jgi:hypothetical protein